MNTARGTITAKTVRKEEKEERKAKEKDKEKDEKPAAKLEFPRLLQDMWANG